MDRCEASDILKEHGIRPTRIRVGLFHRLHEWRGCFCAEEVIHDSATGSHYQESPGQMDPATVYRFLQLLSEHHLIREIAHLEGKRFYEIACHHNPEHAHFYCDRCRHLYCGATLHSSETLQMIRLVPDHEPAQITVLMRGVCSRCRTRKKE